MKRFHYRLVIVLVLIGLVTNLFAVPAENVLMTRIQKDRRTLDFYLIGDEWLSFARTIDGYTLLPQEDGDYYYAILDKENNMVASNVLACNPAQRTQEENAFLSSVEKNLNFSASQRQNRGPQYKILDSNYPTTGDNPLLVILVGFQDRPFTFTQADFQSMVADSGYTNNGATGSVREYYYDNSFGQLRLIPTVVGPFMLSHDMAYYGATGPSFSDIRPKDMISEACALADSLGGVDFTQFDVNNDGIIDAVHVIFAGRPESTTGETDAIWPHRWTIYDTDTNIQKYFDGVRLKDYSCSEEIERAGNMANIGTICHEFGHVLGLPDYYDTDYAGSGGNATALSSWSIMAAGSYNNGGKTPPIFNLNERTLMGWTTPDTLDLQGIYPLYPLIDSNAGYILTTTDTDDYYLIENRSQLRWDEYLPNKGMLIYHIKTPLPNDNCVNCDPTFQKCDIVEADNDDSQTTLISDVFTHPNVNHYFTHYDNPYCFKWSDMSRIEKPITNISMDTNGLVTFRYLIPDTLPIIRTVYHEQVTGNTYKLIGNNVYDGIDQDPIKGFLVSANASFDVAEFFEADEFSTDTFYYTIEGLDYGRTYYYKAAALVNGGDMIVGERKFFTTSNGQPVMIMRPITEIGLDTLRVTGIKVTDGVFPVTEYGIVYDSVSSVDTLHNRIRFYGDFDTLTVTLTNLEQNTKYWCRLYVITELGIRYSTAISATTKFIPIENNVLQEKTGEKCSMEMWSDAIGSEPTGGKGSFRYLWQMKNSQNSVWQDAQGVNDERNYSIGALESALWLRRLVFSYNIKDTSNIIYINVRQSIAGNIYGRDSLEVGLTDTLVLKNYKGNLLSWEVNDEMGNSVLFSQMQDSIAFSSNEENVFYVLAQVQDSTCPIATAEKRVKYYDVLGLENRDAKHLDIKVTPIPANKDITIHNSTNTKYDFILYDAQGREVRRENEVLNADYTLDVSSLHSGTYILYCYTKEGREKIIKILINR